MSIKKQKRAAQVLGGAAVAFGAILAGCGDDGAGPSATPVATATATATPTPAVAAVFRGTYRGTATGGGLGGSVDLVRFTVDAQGRVSGIVALDGAQTLLSGTLRVPAGQEANSEATATLAATASATVNGMATTYRLSGTLRRGAFTLPDLAGGQGTLSVQSGAQSSSYALVLARLTR